MPTPSQEMSGMNLGSDLDVRSVSVSTLFEVESDTLWFY